MIRSIQNGVFTFQGWDCSIGGVLVAVNRFIICKVESNTPLVSERTFSDHNILSDWKGPNKIANFRQLEILWRVKTRFQAEKPKSPFWRSCPIIRSLMNAKAIQGRRLTNKGSSICEQNVCSLFDLLPENIRIKF